MYTQGWARDWQVCSEDLWLSEKIIPVFESYLSGLADSGASKSAFNRHKNACRALGGHIIGEVFGYETDTFSEKQTGIEILLHYISESDGPLVYQDNESWQKEIDIMCRKLFKYIQNSAI